MEVASLEKTYYLPKLIRQKARTNLNGWSVAAGFVVLVISIPLFVIILNMFRGPGDVWHHLATTVLWGYILNSLLLIVGTSATTLLLGVTSAWLVTAYRFPGRRVFDWGLALPLAVPTYIVAFTYAGLLDFTGPLQNGIRSLFGLEGAVPLDIMTMPGAIFVISVVLYPYVYLLARAAFTQQSRSVLEAARILGASTFQTFVRVALPLARPAIVGGLLLVIMETLNDYGAVKYYGISTFTTGIFRAWLSLGDADAAIRLCAFLMVFVLTLSILERVQRGRRMVKNSVGSHTPMRPLELTGSRAAIASVACFVPVALGFLLPAAQLLIWSWQTAGDVVDVEFLTLLVNSFMLAGIASVLAISVALLIVYAVRLRSTNFLRSLSRIAILGYSIPGAVIAIGVMLPFAWMDTRIDAFFRDHFGHATGLILSGTLIAICFAYVVRFLALAFHPVEAGFEKSCKHLDEASRSLGVPPLKTLFRINLPLIKGALVGAGTLVFVDVVKELPLTLILRPFNFDTLATRAFELASNEMIAESANAALIIIGAGILPIILLNKLLANGELWRS